ncbi:MAG TPA: ATP synthase subunit I [Kofleriaceae bacterium]
MLLQLTMTLVVAVVAGLIGGVDAAFSALLGGLACVVPSALFAVRLALDLRRPGGATGYGFFVGEFAKLALTVLMLFGIATVYRDLNWLALIVGFIAALKSYFLMFVFGRSGA